MVAVGGEHAAEMLARWVAAALLGTPAALRAPDVRGSHAKSPLRKCINRTVQMHRRDRDLLDVINES
jgi:hypothetical protein